MAVKKLSYNDVVRKAKKYLEVTNLIMDDMVHQLTLERMHAEIMIEVNRQVAEGEITKHELFQWRLKWKSSRDSNVPPDQLADYLGLPNLKSNYQQIYDYTSQEVADKLTEFYLRLEV